METDQYIEYTKKAPPSQGQWNSVEGPRFRAFNLEIDQWMTFWSSPFGLKQKYNKIRHMIQHNSKSGFYIQVNSLCSPNLAILE